jgi:hypothetical protein
MIQLKKRLLLTGGLFAAGLLAVGIGYAAIRGGDDNGGDVEPAAPHVANGTAGSGARDVDRFLMRRGEQPGFRPDGEASTIVGVNAIAKYWQLAPADAQQLRDRGFISFTTRRTLGRRGAAGVHELLLFRTPEGARDQMAYDLRASTIHATLPETTIRRFTVGDVPGARGWTGTDLHGNPIGTVQWVQGRCMLLLVSEGDLPFVDVLSSGARAIYERTEGDCP